MKMKSPLKLTFSLFYVTIPVFLQSAKNHYRTDQGQQAL